MPRYGIELSTTASATSSNRMPRVPIRFVEVRGKHYFLDEDVASFVRELAAYEGDPGVRERLNAAAYKLMMST